MPIKTRLLYLLVAWLSSAVVYIGSSFVTGSVWIIPEMGIDDYISFSPYGIWLYLMFYIYIPYTFLAVDTSKVKRLAFAFIIISIISGILFILIPSSLNFPSFKKDGISAYVLQFISENDTPQNCFPSMHASLITACTFANWNKNEKLKSYLLILLTLIMYYSIIQVRRHLFIDLAGGIILALFVWWWSKKIKRFLLKPKAH